MLDIDTAIKHCLEVAEQNETQADKIGRQFIGSAMDKCATDCRECAADHRQLAEWLTELKEAKRLLKLALNDFETIESNLEYDEHCVIKTHSIRCDECPLSAETIYRCKWRHADEALALIGEDTNAPTSADDTNVGGKIEGDR